ncbi:3,4-dihydroxy-2-butanone-4-phosphate synthase [Nonomuraea rhodomycinica]|uniref:3,4-dihydroxy-2-butanone-4-phosphate synthase n=1 Tax=Nonomuraea rhodomycinica TaxID=1712872 RepID=UPI0028AA4634|nr:3,4-dihydroxy-2-butanone-4-phosphate synthase [Nonomuraea rhodomycinica]
MDAVGKVVRVDDDGAARRVWIKPPERLLGLVVAKGQIAVDGVSLTVAEVSRDRFCVALIPVTLGSTALAGLAAGDRVNLESDLVVRLVRRWPSEAGPAVSEAALPWAGRVACRRRWRSWPPEAFTFLLTQVCGHPTVPCAPEVLERLELGPVPGPGDRHGTRPHVLVDLVAGTGTGVSAAERAAAGACRGGVICGCGRWCGDRGRGGGRRRGGAAGAWPGQCPGCGAVPGDRAGDARSGRP